ncbi:NUDIX domain-containing protein [Actinomadura luteofluorescens]|uniref:NUDIX domain-containing protein n=1 Tax=Actinomadura luteofluorescens TaxID=46163 RepID=UPI003624C3EB
MKPPPLRHAATNHPPEPGEGGAIPAVHRRPARSRPLSKIEQHSRLTNAQCSGDPTQNPCRRLCDQAPSWPRAPCLRPRRPASGRHPGSGRGVQPGETPEQAVLREVFEETGLRTASVVGPLGVEDKPHPDTG